MLMNLGNVFLLTACLTIGACSSSDPMLGDLPSIPQRAVPIEELAPETGTFAIGDYLELFVKEDSTLNGSYQVRQGGYIVIPRAGRIEVVGLNRNEAELKVKLFLQQTQLTQASVLIERTNQNTASAGQAGSVPPTNKIMIYVTGAVFKPGTHYIPLPHGKDLGVYEALLITGGLARLAQDQRVELIRADATGKRHRATIDVRRISQGLAEDPPVGEGDIIHVPEKVFGF